MERFINILVLSKNTEILDSFKFILRGRGNNVLLFSNQDEAFKAAENKEIGIYILDFEMFDRWKSILVEHLSIHALKKRYLIPLFTEAHSDETISNTLKEGAVDYIRMPMDKELIRNKIHVYKSMYHKDQRITQLLQNIFPNNVLNEVGQMGKFSPKKVQNGVVLFTDFVDFSSHSKKLKPLSLIKKLEYYFSEFDRIVEKYKVEKIKTIGDAYMALTGVSEDLPHPAVRACLAALEMRSFMEAERDVAIALKRSFWEIRIGVHMGPLVAGIIGTSRYSFDVWGDTVNVAARAEEASRPGTISITSNINDGISHFFKTQPRGKIDIRKRGGSIEMFYLKGLKSNYSIDHSRNTPSPLLREKCGLSPMDFDRMRTQILNRLTALLPENLNYHELSHTLNVEKAAIRYAELEGVKGIDLLLLRTATLYHDAGFIHSYHCNEDFAMKMVQSILPSFGYSEEQIKIIQGIIEATKSDKQPETLLQQIMCDADHDYLGRPDYFTIAKQLRIELEEYGTIFTEIEWINFQLEFLENKQRYYTVTAQNIRNLGKMARIKDLKKQLENESLHEKGR